MRTARVAVAAAWVLAAVVSPVMGYDYGWDPGKIQGYGMYMEVAQETFLPDVGWEGAWAYTIDCYTDGSYSPDFMMWGFDNADISNFHDGLGGWDPDYEHNIYQRWDGTAAGSNPLLYMTPYASPDNVFFDYASYAVSPSWTIPAGRPYAIDNTAHVPADYATTVNAISTAYNIEGGATYTNTAGTSFLASQDGLYMEQWNVGAGNGHDPGLLWSVRVVVPALPVPTCICPGASPYKYFDGDITWSVPDMVGGGGGLFPVLGMPEEPPMDWPGIIDEACDAIGGPIIDGYDFDADGDVDEDDVIYLIENLVEWSNATNSGTGTKRGDFNLDGYVNATDLAIMKVHFGDSDVGWADGNANCDDVVNATDLAILKSTFGFVAPTGAAPVPEPTCLALLTLGAGAILGRRAS